LKTTLTARVKRDLNVTSVPGAVLLLINENTETENLFQGG
jgi:hypothetical protein